MVVNLNDYSIYFNIVSTTISKRSSFFFLLVLSKKLLRFLLGYSIISFFKRNCENSISIYYK